MADSKFFPEVTQKQVTETGVLAAVLCTGIGLYQENYLWFKIAFGAGLITLLWPILIYPVARVWFAIGQVLSRISSAVLLTLLFVFIVIPMAALKQWFGKDTLQLRKFKKNKDSVFINRNHTFTPADIQYPF